MTSVLAPRGIGLWGQPLNDMSATGSYARLPPDAYNKNSIGQRGGSVRVPLAQVGPSAGTRPGDPMGKQAAALIVSMSPYPLRTLRDGLIGGGRDASAIRVPLAHVTPTEAEVATRITQEAKSETPSSAMPVTLNQAIELLKAAEEGWQGNDVDYEALLADAQRLKAIRAVAKRRPIRDDEQALINSLADKYSGAIETAVSDSSRRQQALIAKQADPSAQGVADADAMRAAIAARFAPHDRAKVAAANQQATAIDRLLGPKLNRIPEKLKKQRDAIVGALAALQGGDPTLPPGDPGAPQSLTSLRAASMAQGAAITALQGGNPLLPPGGPGAPRSLNDIVNAIDALGGNQLLPTSMEDIADAIKSLRGGDPLLPPGDPGAPQSLTSIRNAVEAKSQGNTQTQTMLTNIVERGDQTLAEVQSLRGALSHVKVQTRKGTGGQFAESIPLVDSSSSGSPQQVNMLLSSSSSSSSLSGVPNAVVDPNNLGGVMIGQTTTTTSSPSPGTGKNKKAQQRRVVIS